MIYVVFGIVGAFWGGLYFHGAGAILVGGLAGIVVAAVISLRNRIRGLEIRIRELDAIIDRLNRDGMPEDAETPVGSADAEDDAIYEAIGRLSDDQGAASQSPQSTHTPKPSTQRQPTSSDVATAPTAEKPLPEPDRIHGPSGKPGPAGDAPSRAAGPAVSANRLAAVIYEWFTGGNLLVRIGVVVLLFGFAFLVKYAAARNMVPLELRLAAAFAAGIGMLVLGWRLREARFGYAVTLQGGGIGVMYLTLFAAARLFGLVPLPLTLFVMIGLVAFSGLLAVLQNAAAMAVIGSAGGFMAPVLLSTGSGSHVMLFSYYALLNAGIFGIAWYRAWRWLNLIGFFFTFGIGSAWGLEYYRPAHFDTTEPFLVLFLAFYLTISILFAIRQPPRLKGYVDGTLVFGLPLVVFTLQSGLVRGMPYALAFSALILALVYTGVATWLWPRRDEGLRALVEAFLALGVVFGSLAIPLALSGAWTAVTWSLEGAGLVWVGLRQKRWLARNFGLLLQVGAGVMFLWAFHHTGATMPVFNSRFLGAMMVAGAGLISAFLLERYRDRLYRLESFSAGIVLAWGLIWWFLSGFTEIAAHLPGRHEATASLAYIGVSVLAMGLLYRQVAWKAMRFPAAGLLPAFAVAVLVQSGLLDGRHPFKAGWILVWPLLFATHLVVLRIMESAWPRLLAACWHLVGAVAAILLVSGEGAWLLDRLAGGDAVWGFIVWGGLPAGCTMLALRIDPGPNRWPLDNWATVYRVGLPATLIVGLYLWSVIGLTLDGNPHPLPYLPLLNPLDLMQMVVFLTIVNATVVLDRIKPSSWTAGMPEQWQWVFPVTVAVAWLTAVVARTVHHYGGIVYSVDAMLHSAVFHAAVAVVWGFAALGAMITANRLGQRSVWFAGAGLLAVVVGKLFVVDLAGSGTISRIVSFLAVGALLLVIGFFTPLPPASSKGPSQ